MNVLDLAKKHVQLRRVSGNRGGEWQGPCPGCGESGHDQSTGPSNRFHVWPADNNGTGRYWCRPGKGCGKSGDNIQFLIDFEGLTFKAACARLQIGLGSMRRSETPATKPKAFEPPVYDNPADLWTEKATKLLEWSQERLMENDEALGWLAARGIRASLAARSGLGWNPGEKGRDIYRSRESWGLPTEMTQKEKPRKLWIPRGLVIPLEIDGALVRLRIRRFEDDGPRYYMLPGGSPATMVIGEERPAFVVVESELDAILCSLHPCAGAVALGSVSARPDERAYKILADSKGVLVGIDFDRAGAAAFGWWPEQFRHAFRWPVPEGKDPGEAFKAGVDIYDWIDRGLTPAARIYKPKPAAAPVEEKREQAQDVVVEPAAADTTSGDEEDLPASVRELHDLLRRNPAVIIFNTPERLSVERDKRYVGGRINELVYRDETVRAFILAHPAEKITGENLL